MIPFGWHVWRGESGRRYRFKVTLTDRGIPDSSGIYVFVRRRFFFFLEPLYVGKATSFRSRVLGHERWMEAWWQRGATERHVLRIRDARERAMIEEDIIRHYCPLMNRVLVPRTHLDAPNDPTLRALWRFDRWLESLFRPKHSRT